jgi:hypothetical protein
MSYSSDQIVFILQNYIDIASGNMPIDKAKEFLKSAGRKNPADTFLIWKADIDRAISSLCPKNDIWCLISSESNVEKIRSYETRLPRMQRVIVRAYILDEWLDWNGLFYGEYEVKGIISRMRKFLNGELYTGPYRRAKTVRAGYSTLEANALPTPLDSERV